MEEKVLLQLKKRITEEITKLKSNISSMEETVNPVSPDQAIGRLSRLDTMMNQGVNKSSIANSKYRILKLEAAIERIESDPFFGECSECGEEIPIARLLAVPESDLCVKCAG